MTSGMISQLVLLLVIANGTPALLGLVIGDRWRCPLDGDVRLWDNQPLFGSSKTVHGILAALLVTGAASPLFGLPFASGVAFAALAMLGDLISSFTKRRLRLASGRSVPLLDQLPETLLPLFGLQAILGASTAEIMVAVVLFLVIDLLLSRVLRAARA